MTLADFYIQMVQWAVREMAFWLQIIMGTGLAAMGAALIGLALCRR